jgi:hypothetical protein
MDPLTLGEGEREMREFNKAKSNGMKRRKDKEKVP